MHQGYAGYMTQYNCQMPVDVNVGRTKNKVKLLQKVALNLSFLNLPNDPDY